MKQRITALLLALGLTAGLTACSPKNPAPDESVSPSPAITEAVSPTPDVTPDPAPTEGDPTVEPDVTELPDKGTPPPENSQPVSSIVPPETEQPSPTPAETPAPDPVEPSDTPSIGVLAASEVYAAVAKSAGDTTATMDASSVLENFYSLSASDLEDFVLYIPEFSSNIEEIFIARAKPGKAANVKSACEGRLAQLQDDAATYPATGGYVADYKLVTEGDWVLFCVCPDSAGAVKAFQNAVK